MTFGVLFVVMIRQTRAILITPENWHQEQPTWNPPVVYSISELLFELDYKNVAVRWFYIGQLRARCDANYCQDETARSAVGILNDKFGRTINTYAFEDGKPLSYPEEEWTAIKERTIDTYYAAMTIDLLDEIF